MKNIFITLLMLVTTVTAGAQKKKEINTPVSLNYCLPKVAYRLEITMQCIRHIPGPYGKYAEKELGMKPETGVKERWRIAKIDIRPQYLPDEKAVYSISASNNYNSVLLSWSAEGFLAGVSVGDGESVFNEGRMENVRGEGEKEKEVDMMRLGTYNPLKEVLDTNYTYQEVDGEMKKIWDPLVHYAPKTDSDNIKEAVSEIFRIRSERVKLLGAGNEVPDGKSLDIILEKFDRMEADYLSLFMGRQETRMVKRVITCLPQKAEEAVVAFRFSEQEGIADPKNVSVPAYMLKVAGVTVPASKPVSGDDNVSAIYYRVPAVGELQLWTGKEKLMTCRTIVPQFGEVKKFPLDVIGNEDLILEFYPRFGSLRSVRKR